MHRCAIDALWKYKSKCFRRAGLFSIKFQLLFRSFYLTLLAIKVHLLCNYVLQKEKARPTTNFSCPIISFSFSSFPLLIPLQPVSSSPTKIHRCPHFHRWCPKSADHRKETIILPASLWAALPLPVRFSPFSLFTILIFSLIDTNFILLITTGRSRPFHHREESLSTYVSCPSTKHTEAWRSRKVLLSKNSDSPLTFFDL